MDKEELFTGERFMPGILDLQLETEHFQRYLSVVDLVRGKDVLDAACGEGYGSSILASVANRVIGIDLDKQTIARAKSKYVNQDNLHFMQGDIKKLNLPDDCVDVVVSFETIEHVPEEAQREFLNEISRVLRPDGFLVMSTPNKKIYSDFHNYKNEFHVKEFYFDEFLEFLREKFCCVEVYNQFFEVTSIISDCKKGDGKAPFFVMEKGDNTKGKFFIAVASNQKIRVGSLASVYIRRFGEYEKKLERIQDLQNAEEERNRHIQTLNKEIERLGGIIRELQTDKEERDGHVETLNKEIERLGGIIRELQTDKEERDRHVETLNKEIERLGGIIRELQTDKEEGNLHVKVLDDLVSQYKIRIEGYADAFSKQSNILSLQTEQLIQQSNMIDALTRTKELLESNILKKDEQIAEYMSYKADYEKEKGRLMQIICNKDGHIEQLLESERAYEREKSTYSYRFGKRIQKICNFFLPQGSRRRFFARVLYNFIKHPQVMVHVINPKRIKHYFKYMKLEGLDGVKARYKKAVKNEEDYLRSKNETQIVVTDTTADENRGVDPKLDNFEVIFVPDWVEPEVSIIIPVYNEFLYTYNCIKSIVKNTHNVAYEIIIADDCSTDLTKDLSCIIKNVRQIKTEKNARFLLNCNNAAKSAKGKYILFLNNDTQVQEDWLYPLVKLMIEDNSIGLVGSKLLYPDGSLQEAGGIIWKDATAWNYGNHQNPNSSEFNYVREVDYISGAAIMIRKNLWNEIGGFDERFVPAYCEDSDLAFEVRRHGYKVVYQPSSVVVHFEGISNGTDLNNGQKSYQVANQKKLFEKWEKVLEEENFENGTNVFLARDRSRGRKHVLVIDHYVPQYDKDAGSKTTFMYLKMMVQKGFHITFLGDNFCQHEPYTTELQQMGIFVLYGPQYAENWQTWLLNNIQFFDVFYLNRPHIAIKYIDLIKKHAKGKIIYYGHDLHFMRIKREYELSKDKRLLEESKSWMEKELYIMRKADMNYYPSELEKDEINKLDKTIPVKAITAYIYNECRNVEYDISMRNGLLFVGGFGHSPNVDAVKWFLNEVYPQIYIRTKAPFYIVGSNAPAELSSIHKDGVVMKGFVTEEELKHLYDTCRIAVVPLRYGAGVKGKVVEALYNGIPVVTTPIGAEGISGIEEVASIQQTGEDMLKAICSLYKSGEDLKKMSQAGQNLVKRNFSIEAVWKIIKEDFE